MTGFILAIIAVFIIGVIAGVMIFVGCINRALEGPKYQKENLQFIRKITE